MRMKDVCRREIVAIDAAAPLCEAAALMRRHHVGALMVTDNGGAQAIGIVTDRDLAIEVLARSLAGADMTVAQLASDRLVAVGEGADIAEAVRTMEQAGVRRLLVTSEAGQVVGLVSIDDLLEALAGELSGLAAALRAGLAREAAERKAIAVAPSRPVFLPQGTPGMPWPTRL